MYQHLKEWFKNPRWSFSCCLALVLPLVDLQTEIHNVAAEDAPGDQIEVGGVELPDGMESSKDNSDVGVSSKPGNGMLQAHDENWQRTDYVHGRMRFHQGTQTQLLAYDHRDKGV